MAKRKRKTNRSDDQGPKEPFDPSQRDLSADGLSPDENTPDPEKTSSALWRWALLVVVAFVGLTATFIAQALYRPLQLPTATADVQQIVEIKPGEALSAALLRFQNQGMMDAGQRWALLLYLRFPGHAKSVHAGEYALPAELNSLDLLFLIQSGKVVLHDVRIIEGWTLAQAVDALNHNAFLQHTLQEAGAGAEVQAQAEAIWRAVGASEPFVEGWFFPDTYRVAKGTSDIVVLREAYRAMKKHLEERWAARDPAVAYRSPEEALIMASLVEKESAVEQERTLIAGVFLHRLSIGMRLQTDPSVIYGMGARFDGNLRSRDLTTDTPFNSYTREGLPPTPICLPGLGALDAALHPATTDALYFVSRGNGTHQFSSTLSEHNAAVRKYQLHQESPAAANANNSGARP